jgi:hypothetical protein
MRPYTPTITDFEAYCANYPRPSRAGFHARHPSVDWCDATTPRTDKPVRFVPATRVPFGLCWGMVNKWAVSPSRIA